MPSSEVVVANTSPILNLALVDRLPLLRRQLGSITIPTSVREELLAGEDGNETLREVLDGDDIDIRDVTRHDLVREFRAELDRGEAEAIALAIERDADLILLDERDGRRVARRHGVSVTGVIGLLLRDARDGGSNMERALEELRNVGFWIDEGLYREAIELAESSNSS